MLLRKVYRTRLPVLLQLDQFVAEKSHRDMTFRETDHLQASRLLATHPATISIAGAASMTNTFGFSVDPSWYARTYLAVSPSATGGCRISGRRRFVRVHNAQVRQNAVFSFATPAPVTFVS